MKRGRLMRKLLVELLHAEAALKAARNPFEFSRALEIYESALGINP